MIDAIAFALVWLVGFAVWGAARAGWRGAWAKRTKPRRVPGRKGAR